MEGPTNLVRTRIIDELSTELHAPENRGEADEQLADRLLSQVDEYLGSQMDAESRRLPRNEDEAFERLAMIDEWASVASYIVGRVYSPTSPWPDLVGYGTKAVERLRKIAQKLGELLRPIAKFLKAFSYSVAVAFPFGVSVGISWQPR